MVAPNVVDDLLISVREIWTEVLDVKYVSNEIKFFEAGGDSLLFLVLLERLSRLIENDLDAAVLFDHFTITSQVELLSSISEDKLRRR